jgi:beta-lactamase superfamily II metal-dependent hydrolase
MKLSIFQSSHGDCLLLESRAGKRILCDGGMPDAMATFVAPALQKLRDKEPDRPIDVVYVSHVDMDHIGGVQALLENAADWLVFEKHGPGSGFSKPDVPRPPKIGTVWHNAFKDQMGSETTPIENLLAASARTFFGLNSEFAQSLGHEQSQIALGVKEAIKVSKLANDVLKIPINQLPGAGPAKLLMARNNQPAFSLDGDSMSITIVGPTQAELAELRRGWNVWLGANAAQVESIRAETRERMRQLANGAVEPSIALAWLGQPGFKGVTTPNIASLVLLVEEDGKSLLLTGDGQHDLIERHMRARGLLDDAGRHLTCLKVPHHGSNHNLSAKFARLVSADHYVFCGNGENGNPDPEVLDWIFQSRVSTDSKVRAVTPEAADNRPFHFWFSTASSVTANEESARAVFQLRERQVAKLKTQSNGRLKTHFNTKTSLDLAL